MKDIKKAFWLKVKEERQKQKLSQEELAFKAGLHRTYISDIERGNKNISLENIERIANSLWVDLYNIFKF